MVALAFLLSIVLGAVLITRFVSRAILDKPAPCELGHAPILSCRNETISTLAGMTALILPARTTCYPDFMVVVSFGLPLRSYRIIPYSTIRGIQLTGLLSTYLLLTFETDRGLKTLTLRVGRKSPLLDMIAERAGRMDDVDPFRAGT